MPDDLDPPFLVEFKENPGFLGRTEDLERPHAALQDSGTAGEREAVGIVTAGSRGVETELAGRVRVAVG